MAIKKPKYLSQEEWDRIPPHMKGKHHTEMHICHNISNHEYGPNGYGEFMEWSEERSKTHKQQKCDCGFYVIWNPKQK